MQLLNNPFQFEIGAYRLKLPGDAQISATVKIPTGPYRTTTTHWVISLGRFRLSMHLDQINGLMDLKSFIDYSTKSSVHTPLITVNGISGVTYGDYGPPRTWLDWWFKRGDTMICLCLQSVDFPLAEPQPSEMALHEAIIASLQYSRDS